jgi:thiol-disulfide isomerase/thioredoxin
MKLLTIFIYLLTVSFGFTAEKPDIKNLILTNNLKIYEDVIFKDANQKDVDLVDYKGKLLILNFWATWCAPCKEEMPSLDNLQAIIGLNNLKIFPINISKENLSKSESFFSNLNIKNLNIYFDSPITLAKKFSLRGIPTSILFDKEGKEFARVLGSIDFNDKDFIDWLKSYN